jgi:excisionase family DNA binding protein
VRDAAGIVTPQDAVDRSGSPHHAAKEEASNMTVTETPRYRLTEAANRLGISGRTLSDWISAGRVRVVRITSKLVFVEQKEIDRLLRGEMTPAK